jgi:TRAP-type C4-dicarboxylate transport system permease small subunit
MNAIKMAAVALIVAGVLALVYGGFSYTKETHAVKIGTLELSVDEKQDVNIPLWAGIAAIGAGCFMLLVGGNKK